jgi:UDP-N-acetylglucosamine 2-epimerase (non-hydrolysing)
MTDIACVVGTRPNFVKMAAIHHALRTRFSISLIHSGQHYSEELSAQLFRELELPDPDINLDVGSGTQSQQTALIMQRLEAVLLEVTPRLLLVVGDVTSTMAAALVGAKLGIPIAHVEAGLRSFDPGMPEEINRIVTDAVSDFLFVTEPSGTDNLKGGGFDPSRIFLVGNVMIDTLLRFQRKSAQSDVLSQVGVSHKSFAVVTLHRPSNVDSPESLAGYLQMIQRLSETLPVVFPIHPRTASKLPKHWVWPSGVIVLPPQSYLDFIQLVNSSRVVLTDSGGVQEETTVLNVPCITMRDNTERPITVEQGTNQLVGSCPDAALSAARRVLESPTGAPKAPALWDGHAAARITKILADHYPWKPCNRRSSVQALSASAHQ